MDERVGQIPYDEAAALITGFPDFPESEAFATELLLYEKEHESEEQLIDDKTEGEMQITALKIQELIESKFMIYDKSQNKSTNHLQRYRLVDPHVKTILSFWMSLSSLGFRWRSMMLKTIFRQRRSKPSFLCCRSLITRTKISHLWPFAFANRRPNRRPIG